MLARTLTLAGLLALTVVALPSPAAADTCVPVGVLGYEATCASVHSTWLCSPEVTVYLSDPDGGGDIEIVDLCVPRTT